MLRTVGVYLRSGTRGGSRRLRNPLHALGGSGFSERRLLSARNFSVSKDNIGADVAPLNAPSGDPTSAELLTTSPGLPSVDELNILAYSFFSSSEDSEAPAVEDFVPKAMEDLTNSPPDLVIKAIDSFHSFSGLPWWQTIICSTLIARFCVFPLALKGMKGAAKMQVAKPEIDVAKKRFEALKKKNGGVHTNEQQQAFLLEVKAIQKKHGASMLGGLAPAFLQMPLFMSFFFGLKKMHEYVPGFVDGGAYFFQDLTVPDTTYVMPVVCAAAFLATIEMGGEMGETDQGKKMKNVFRGMAFLMIPITISFPCSVLCYWCTNNTFSLAQSTLFRQAGFRKMTGLPTLESMKAAKDGPAIKNAGLTPFSPPMEKTVDADGKTIDEDGLPTFSEAKPKLNRSSRGGRRRARRKKK